MTYKVKPYYICRKGQIRSAIKLGRVPTLDEIRILVDSGWEIAVHGETFWKTLACPVNGDGYKVQRCYLYDSEGTCVGTYNTGITRELTHREAQSIIDHK